MGDLVTAAGVNPDLPQMVAVDDVLAPRAPLTVAETGISHGVLADLALKAAYTTSQFTTEWAARRLHLPQLLVGELLEEFRVNRLLEILGEAGPFGYRYSISNLGRERAARLFELSGYVGPAPVSLAAYTAMLEWQLGQCPAVSPAKVCVCLSELVLPPQAELVAGLAISSGRSLFLSGPPGNGKTSLGRLLHGALEGNLWVPHCIGIESSIIRVYDTHVHEAVPLQVEQPWTIDRRWERVRRPVVVVGGEATIESFDLAYSPTLRYYEAPLHLKADGGTFLIDDFGRQRVDPRDLLNRWIIPLENRIDYLALHTGQKIEVPFRLMLIIATNLASEQVTDPAFLRRMGYRLEMESPTPERYTDIFQRYAHGCGLEVPPGLIAGLLNRYEQEGRELRCCEPRDLIERVRDHCRYQSRSLELNEEVLEVAWYGYFGERQTGTTSA